jgi:hypothetical protein
MEIFQMVMAKQNFLDEKEQRKVKISFAIGPADKCVLNLIFCFDLIFNSVLIPF